MPTLWSIRLAAVLLAFLRGTFMLPAAYFVPSASFAAKRGDIRRYEANMLGVCCGTLGGARARSGRVLLSSQMG